MIHDSSVPTKRHVVIIGGGATGVAAFIALVLNQAATTIDIVDPGSVGQGMAFDASSSSFLCNTSVDTMSLVPGCPDDFLHYLHEQGTKASSNDFVPRALFQRYMMNRYAKYRALAETAGVSHRHIPLGATGVRALLSGDYEVMLADGGLLAASDVLICVGYSVPIVPEWVRAHVGREGIFPSVYPERAWAGTVPERATVLVIGTRLSAIDATLLLRRTGERHVIMASRSGLLPAVRTGTPWLKVRRLDTRAFRALDFASPSLPTRLVKLVRDAVGCESPPNAGDVVEQLRCETRLAAEGHTRWQELLVELVDVTNEILTPAEASVREAALASCHKLLFRYLGAFPLASATALLAHIDQGSVEVSQGVPVRLDPCGTRWRATWANGRAASFDAVVCAAGFHEPRISVTDDIVTFAAEQGRGSLPEITPDLRVVLPGRTVPERVWVLGISSSSRVPLVNAVYQASRQAEAISCTIANSAIDRPFVA